MNSFKVVLVGNGGVGKTTFVKRHRTGEFDKRYLATIGVETNILSFNTSGDKQVDLVIWDTAGQEKFAGLKDGYYLESKAAIVMFSLDSPTSFNSVPGWVRDVRRVCPNIPIVLCGTKCDIADIVVKPSEVRKLMEELDLPYFDISAKTNYNFEKPFLYLIRKLTGDDKLSFVEGPPKTPVTLDVATVPLEEEEEDDDDVDDVEEEECCPTCGQVVPEEW